MKRITDFFGERQFGVIAVLLCLISISIPMEIRGTVAPAHTIDLLIRQRGGGNGFKGNGVGNRTGNRQLVRILRWGHGQASLWIRVQNEGEVPDFFKMRGPKGNHDFRIRFFHKGKNVTGAFRKGNLITPEVPAMDNLTPDFLVKISLGRNVRTGKTKTIKVKGQSIGAPIGDGTDVVKAKLKAP